MKQVELTEHEFAKWLRDHGWNNEYHHVLNATYYYGSEKDRIIAMTNIDNSKCTRKTWIKEDI